MLFFNKVFGVLQGKHLSSRDMLHNSRHMINMRMREQYVVGSDRILRTNSHVDHNFFIWDLDAGIVSTGADNIQ